MDLKKKVKLTPKLIKFLEGIPEQGMGYHLVDIEMKDGNILSAFTILNSSLILVNIGKEIDVKMIKKIKPHRKNDLR